MGCLGTECIAGADDQHGGHLGLIWEDAQTHYELNSPYITGQLLEFTVRHRSGSGNPDQRAAQVKALDQAERTARINSGKPLIRLPRYLELDQIRLGMSRDQVLPALPVGQAIIKRTIPGGISVTFAGEPARNLNYVARQMFLRFDATERLAEIRFRYADGSAATQRGGWHKELLAGLKKQAAPPRRLFRPGGSSGPISPSSSRPRSVCLAGRQNADAVPVRCRRCRSNLARLSGALSRRRAAARVGVPAVRTAGLPAGNSAPS